MSMSSGCDARMCVAQKPVDTTPPSTTCHRSRSSTIRRPLPMGGPHMYIDVSKMYEVPTTSQFASQVDWGEVASLRQKRVSE